ncbi:Uncharacterised protein [Mycolicibacterium fortuitum]|uniref:Uncharacterized protein n=1 Tax=Mycolicibacterium fortuitum TaxID=1766 RepID=A0A378WDW9_MYCFO|nr:Uncharacterised protein [Mycolicibacterium fortuitum]
MSEFVTQTVHLTGFSLDVTASPTDVPHLVLTPMLGRGKFGRVVLTGKLTLTPSQLGVPQSRESGAPASPSPRPNKR